jgi:transposase
MLSRFVTGTEQIFLACGATGSKKQADSLAAIVSMQFHLEPFADQYVFLFCYRKRNGIKIVRYDSNGTILSSKKLLGGMKFQWPKTPEEVKEISCQQVEGLYQGLKIEQQTVLHSVEINLNNTCDVQRRVIYR